MRAGTIFNAAPAGYVAKPSYGKFDREPRGCKDGGIQLERTVQFLRGWTGLRTNDDIFIKTQRLVA
jgi:hypothetical protein